MLIVMGLAGVPLGQSNISNRLAADQGNANAQFNLGFCYDNGQSHRQQSKIAEKPVRKNLDFCSEDRKQRAGVLRNDVTQFRERFLAALENREID